MSQYNSTERLTYHTRQRRTPMATLPVTAQIEQNWTVASTPLKYVGVCSCNGIRRSHRNKSLQPHPTPRKEPDSGVDVSSPSGRAGPWWHPDSLWGRGPNDRKGLDEGFRVPVMSLITVILLEKFTVLHPQDVGMFSVYVLFIIQSLP